MDGLKLQDQQLKVRGFRYTETFLWPFVHQSVNQIKGNKYLNLKRERLFYTPLNPVLPSEKAFCGYLVKITCNTVVDITVLKNLETCTQRAYTLISLVLRLLILPKIFGVHESWWVFVAAQVVHLGRSWHHVISLQIWGKKSPFCSM